MVKHHYQKIVKTAQSLFTIIAILAFSQALWAAPQLTQSKAKGGDCAVCHDKAKVLPDKHVDTKAMNLSACKSCHSKESFSLAGKLTASHFHRLAEVGCVECHGETKSPEPLTIEQCVACHGSTSKLAEKTKDVHPANPHKSPHYGTDLDCNLCHHQHSKSEVLCIDCHKKFNFKVP